MNTALEPVEFEIDIPKDQVERFFSAVGWTLNTKPVSPPTLATVFRKGEFELLKKLKIPLGKVLHGEQQYTFHKPLLGGAKYQAKSWLHQHHEKKSPAGTLGFYVFRTSIFDSHKNLLVESDTNIVVRDVGGA